ncbi:uncharacterized protein LOC134824064 isoform X3 [Bolinopsis microptera]|uniref:uncharacterized protein LOC134824064 isoform X3 n=2 Tax=Bolinopsis microptera TaxID=2820187 RepID=UPI003078B8AC
MTSMGLITMMVAVSFVNSAAPLLGTSDSRIRSNTLEKARPSRYSNLISSKYSSNIGRSWSGDLDSMKRSWSGTTPPKPPPSRHMFGSLDLSLLEGEGSQISFKSTDDDSTGISLSFYLDSLEATEQPQKIMSVYGVDLLAHKETIEKKGDKCSLTLVTGLKFNITYTLKRCTRSHIYLDLYNKLQMKTSSLYENLNIVHGESSRGWCKHSGTKLEESKENLYRRENYSYPKEDAAGNDNIESVKNKCLTEFIEGELCRGITLMKNGEYSLRVGDFPILSFDDDASYINGPCLDTGRSPIPLLPVLEFHKVDVSVKISHINIDPLKDFADPEHTNLEVQRRWRRYELGNIESGQLVNFKDITYNVDFDMENLRNLEKTKNAIQLNRYSNVAISEGMFIQEEFNSKTNSKGKFFKLSDGDAGGPVNFAANFVWNDGMMIRVELRYCINDKSVEESATSEIEQCLKNENCCGLDNDKLVVESCSTDNVIMWKGFCGDDSSEKEERSHFNTFPPTRMNIEPSTQKIMAHQFRSLPKKDNVLNSTTDTQCKFSSNGGFSNNITALLTFKTSQDGFRLFIQTPKDTIETFVRVNESENQSVMHMITLTDSVESVYLKEDNVNDCSLITYTAGICGPLFTQNDYGYFFLDRGEYGDKVNVPCTVNSDKKSSWECNAGTWRQSESSEQCPFYQCYNREGRLHDSTYTNNSRIFQILKDGADIEGNCCGNGKWTAQCSEDYSINYDNCSALLPCDSTEILEFEVKELEGTSIGSIEVSEFLSAKSQMVVSCGYGNGSVTIKCDGCTGKRSVEENTCTHQICVTEGKTKTLNLTWNKEDNIKYFPTDYPYTLEGPFEVDDNVSVPCQYGGEVKLSCSGSIIVRDYGSCTPAPKCSAQEVQLGPLKGNVTFDQVFAGETQTSLCPISEDNESHATVICNSDGEWGDIDHSSCGTGPCSETTFSKNGVRFVVKETDLDTVSSSTECYFESCLDGENCPLLDMCSDGTCGSKRCSSSLGGYSTDTDYSTCRFNCTYEEKGMTEAKTIEHGTFGSFKCIRNNGAIGLRYVDCKNGEVTKKSCGLMTCPYTGGSGCVETDPEMLKGANPSELAADLDSFLDNVDLSSAKAKSDTNNVVSAVMTNSPDGPKSQEEKANIGKVIDKVAINLAKSGGMIESAGVKMYGVTGSDLLKGGSNFLTDNKIEGTGFNGNVGFSLFDDMELFTPKNTTKEKMVGTAVKSITTEFKSDNINVNLSFPLKIKCNTSTTQCRYLDPSTGQWLTEGVTTICDGRKTICQSTHLTSFAVLVSLDLIEDPAQSIATKIMLTISVACLSATAIAFIPFRKLRNRDIIRIHLCLIFSSIIANLAFLSLETTIGSVTGCYISTFVTHFAWLSVFGWMMAEGVTMYRQTVQALKSYGKKIDYYTTKCAIIVHTVALIPPIIGVVLHFKMPDIQFQYIRGGFEFDNVCFLDTPNTLMYLFLGPLYVVVCFSLFFFVRVTLVVVKSKRQSTSKSQDQTSFWKKQAKAVGSIATATGIAWVVAPFVILDTTGGHYSTILQWVFNIVLGMQGAITFLVLVVLSDEVKNCWRAAYKGSQMEKMGDAFASMGHGLGELHMRKKSKRAKHHDNTRCNRKSQEPGTTIFEHTKSSHFLSIIGRSHFHNIFSKAQSHGSLVDESTHSSGHHSNHHNRANTPNDVFSPVEEVSDIFNQGSDSWVKFVEKAEGGMVPSEAGISIVVPRRRTDIASDSGFHGDEDMSTSC